MLSLTENFDKQQWDIFLIKNDGSFLQSFAWGEFQRSQGKKIWRWKIINNNETIAQTQILKERFPLKIGSCLYIPFGPVFRKDLSPSLKTEAVNLILDKAQKLSSKENILFLIIEPKHNLPHSNQYSHRFLLSVKRMQPRKTLILDLSLPRNYLFRNFSPTLRYDIRLAQRKGVEVKFSNNYHSAFYDLLQKTAQRGHFHPFAESYYKRLFDFATENFQVKLSLASFKSQTIASYIMIFFGKEAICLHGGADRKFKALQAPSLLQWEQIKIAQERGYKIYDFWGIDDKKMKGVTFFKKSFRGKEIEYPSGIDFIFQPFAYYTYRILKKVRKCF